MRISPQPVSQPNFYRSLTVVDTSRWEVTFEDVDTNTTSGRSKRAM